MGGGNRLRKRERRILDFLQKDFRYPLSFDLEGDLFYGRGGEGPSMAFRNCRRIRSLASGESFGWEVWLGDAAISLIARRRN